MLQVFSFHWLCLLHWSSVKMHCLYDSNVVKSRGGIVQSQKVNIYTHVPWSRRFRFSHLLSSLLGSSSFGKKEWKKTSGTRALMGHLLFYAVYFVALSFLDCPVPVVIMYLAFKTLILTLHCFYKDMPCQLSLWGLRVACQNK